MVVYFRQHFTFFIGGYNARVIPATIVFELADIARALFPPPFVIIVVGGYNARVIPASSKIINWRFCRDKSANL